MIYRKMEKLGITTSLLGFGCMRLPLTPDNAIDEAETARMFDMAYHAGVNYFDTAYGYHDGESERVTGRMLQRYPRNTFYVATKLPMYKVRTLAQAKAIFEEQRAKLQMEHIDFYLLHTLNRDTYNLAVREGIVEYCEQLKRDGKIRYLGFSFHDSFDSFKHIINDRDWDFCQIQYNYRDRNFQAGDRGYELATKLGVPVIVMEPVRGGQLSNLPVWVTEPFRRATPGATDASFALRWVASHPNVKVILSGMSAAEQMEDNLRTFDQEQPLTETEEEAIEEVNRRIISRVKIGCTACRYCMPCPNGVDIPGNFRVWNDLGMYGMSGSVNFHWNMQIPESAKALNCARCGQCEAKCPQHLPIMESLKTLQAELDAACGK
jgi:uncharacterized protein